MADSYTTFRAQRFFGSLDGLRAISIAAVIWHHTGGKDIIDVGLLGRGYYGVHLFFAISGFLITTLLLREKESKGEISLPKFYIRRTLRIFPLFYTVLLIYTILVYLIERNQPYGQVFFVNLKYFATYTSNWFVDLTPGTRNIFYYAWSLATEEQFYLVWPWVERFMKGKAPVYAMIGVLAFSEIVRVEFLSGVIPLDSLLHRIITSVAPPICLGVLLAHLLHSRKGYDFTRKILGFKWSSLLTVAVGAVIVGTDLHRSALLIGIAMALIVAACVVREDHFLAPILRSKPFQHTGMVSYGMYLWHMLAYHAFVHPLHLSSPLLLFIVEMLATVTVASISFKFYESRFLKLKERYAS